MDECLDALDFAVPHSRPRSYCYFLQDSAEAVPDDAAWKGWQRRFRVLLRSAQCPREHMWDTADFLLDSTDPLVRSWQCERAQIRDEKDASEQVTQDQHKLQKYEELHCELFMNHGFRWPPDLGSHGVDFGDSIAHLTRRQGECAWFHEALRRQRGAQAITGNQPQASIANPPTRHPVVMVDMNMSLHYQLSQQNTSAAGVFPCLVSTSRPWLVELWRDMAGHEAMGLQGWEPAAIQKGFKHQLLFDIAGNSFNGFVLDVIILCLAATVPWVQTFAISREWCDKQKTSGALEPANSEVGSSSALASDSD